MNSNNLTWSWTSIDIYLPSRYLRKYNGKNKYDFLFARWEIFNLKLCHTRIVLKNYIP